MSVFLGTAEAEALGKYPYERVEFKNVQDARRTAYKLLKSGKLGTRQNCPIYYTRYGKDLYGYVQIGFMRNRVELMPGTITAQIGIGKNGRTYICNADGSLGKRIE